MSIELTNGIKSKCRKEQTGKEQTYLHNAFILFQIENLICWLLLSA